MTIIVVIIIIIIASSLASVIPFQEDILKEEDLLWSLLFAKLHLILNCGSCLFARVSCVIFRLSFPLQHVYHHLRIIFFNGEATTMKRHAHKMMMIRRLSLQQEVSDRRLFFKTHHRLKKTHTKRQICHHESV